MSIPKIIIVIILVICILLCGYLLIAKRPNQNFKFKQEAGQFEPDNDPLPADDDIDEPNDELDNVDIIDEPTLQDFEFDDDPLPADDDVDDNINVDDEPNDEVDDEVDNIEPVSESQQTEYNRNKEIIRNILMPK